MCPKKYKEVFQQFYQYDVLAVSTNKNAVKKDCKTNLNSYSTKRKNMARCGTDLSN